MNGDDTLIGKMLDLRYQILEEIGSGGMAVVYKAKCHMLNRFVAVKVLKPEFKNDKEIVAKFKTESQAAASLSHQNIVSVYDIGEYDGISYIVMEYVEGVTLKEYIRKKGMLTWREACEFAKQICDAIEQAHRNSIIHNDIKPHNILITPDNVAKVTDFGIARAVSSVNADTMVVGRSAIGSVYYMSPEQDKGRFTDARSDIYSIGIVLYEMLAGKVPFDGENHVMISLKKLEEEPTDVRIYNPDIPERVSALVMKAIARESHARFQTAHDMSKELTRVMSRNYESYEEDDYNEEIDELSQTKKTKPISEKSLREERMKHSAKHSHVRNNVVKNTPVKPENNKSIKSSQNNTKRRSDERMSVILAVVTGLVVFAIMAGTYLFMTGGKREIVVPELLGLTVEEAQRKIEGMDLTIIEPVQTQSDNEVEAGKIIQQNPGANKAVKKDTEIVLTVSTGPETKTGDIKVPDLTDLPYADAVKLLNDMKLRAVKIDEESDTAEEGMVIHHEPVGGDMVTENTAIMVYVSSGSKTKIKVPSLKGKTKEEAEKALKEAGLVIGKITKEESQEAEGTVIKQSPEAGEEVSKNSQISVVLSSPKSQTTNPPAATLNTTILENTKAPQVVNTLAPAKTNPPVQSEATPKPVITSKPQPIATNPPAVNNNTTQNTQTQKQQSQTKTLTVSFPDSVGETVQVRIEANGNEIYNKSHKKSEGGTQVQVRGSKDAEVKIYFDDKLVSTKTINFD